jgi:hypothetical protein
MKGFSVALSGNLGTLIPSFGRLFPDKLGQNPDRIDP